MRNNPFSRFLKTRIACTALLPLAAALCPGGAAAQTVGTGESAACNPTIAVAPTLPQPKGDPSTGGVNVCDAAQYAWQTMIALNWAADAKTRNDPDAGKPFGVGSPTVWESYRSKVELYPGLGGPTVPPHGVTLNGGKPSNPETFYGYGRPPKYVYSEKVGQADGDVKACKGQQPVDRAAWVVLDETTQIGNNQTFAGTLQDDRPTPVNAAPRLIRYGVKMNRDLYVRVVAGEYWYRQKGAVAPINVAQDHYKKQLSAGQTQNPETPYVDLAPRPGPDDGSDDGAGAGAGITVKTAWRPLTEQETSSGRFVKSTVRYYEDDEQGTPCWREAEWGLVGMHLVTFTRLAPWGIWSTFEQADNILTADGKRTEDENGAMLIQPNAPPTTPILTSNPGVPDPKVEKTGEYCTNPGNRLYFRENPAYKTLPADGDVCVNTRWHPIPDTVVKINKAAHDAIRDDQLKTGAPPSPWLFYKLVNAQGTPVDYDFRNGGRLSTESSYYLANAVIETDYSLGMFTGDLVKGAPSNVKVETSADGKKTATEYFNTRLLPFQQGNAKNLTGSPLRMGGCAGCHGFAATQGTDFSFALLGGNVQEPEAVHPFTKKLNFRNYMPE